MQEVYLLQSWRKRTRTAAALVDLIMKEKLKLVFKKNLYLNAFIYVLYNLYSHLKILIGNITTSSGTTHSNLSIDESISYIENVFLDYKKVSGIKQFSGKVAEIGPGDNAGVALLFMADGASSVDLADRFYSTRNLNNEKLIYQALAIKYPTIDKFMDTSTAIDNEPTKGISRYYGRKASSESFFKNHKCYDYIVSRAVLEHVNDPILSLRLMYNALNPGGILIHKIDLRDHGMFSPYADPTKFLELPDWLYKLMIRDSGYPNRFLLHEYKKTLSDMGVDFQIHISGLHGVGNLDHEYKLDELPTNLKQKALDYINQRRNKFFKSFSLCNSEDLMISSFFLVCRKPIKNNQHI